MELKAKLETDLPEYIYTDLQRLNQIMKNLISNAIKFTEKGSVNINIKNYNDSTVIISITDTGIGIQENKQMAIFERFTQADSNTNRKYGGSGLGLSIVRKLLQLQNSDIYVNSEVGKGSEFYFTLTFVKSSKKSANEIISISTKKDLKGINILLVEDNKINVVIAKKMLTNWKANVDVAENGSVAVLKFQLNDYDVILMDLQMPIMDGIEASCAIRSLGGNLPIFALSASSLSDVDENIKLAGMNGFISKPFNPNELYNKIKSLLR